MPELTFTLLPFPDQSAVADSPTVLPVEPHPGELSNEPPVSIVSSTEAPEPKRQRLTPEQQRQVDQAICEAITTAARVKSDTQSSGSHTAADTTLEQVNDAFIMDVLLVTCTFAAGALIASLAYQFVQGKRSSA